jgi:tripeptide aminopeptidase
LKNGESKTGDEMRDKLIEYFQILAAIDSPSGKERELADKLAVVLRGLGFSLRRDSLGSIIAARGQGEPLLLCCHMDTVESTAGLELKIEGDYIRSDGSTILGADDKAGIAIILATLENMDCQPALELVFSVQEEKGMEGTKAFKPGDLRAKWGLVLDAGEPVGAVINQAPGETEMEIVIHGRGAHAAANPEEGIDAIRLAASFIDRLPPHRIEEGSTYNLGVIQGGKATNTICPRVQMLGEVRSFEDSQRVRIAAELESLLQHALEGSGGSYDFHCRDSYSGYLVNADHGLIDLLKSTAAPLGIQVDVHSRFAGSDANILNGLGLAVVNLGLGVEGNHSFDERVSISAMGKMAAWLHTILKEWCHERA